MNEHKKEKILAYIAAVLIAAAISLALNYPTMLLWNWLMPKLFHLPALSFWEMYGVMMLLNVLTSFFRGRNK